MQTCPLPPNHHPITTATTTAIIITTTAIATTATAIITTNPMPPFRVIIPARYAASRLPGKPLADIGGKPMIRHVVEAATASAATAVTVATDDHRIAEAVRAFGGEVIMTAADHRCGTDRIAQAVDQLALADQQIVVNVQADEPEMPPALIDQVAALLADDPQAAIATAKTPLDDPAQLHDPSVVKVVTDHNHHALYFSRAAIPWQPQPATAHRHLGIYAYTCAYLRRFTTRGTCELEQQENLEQLRALWHGEKIACALAVRPPGPGIDTADDLARIQRRYAGG